MGNINDLNRILRMQILDAARISRPDLHIPITDVSIVRLVFVCMQADLSLNLSEMAAENLIRITTYLNMHG